MGKKPKWELVIFDCDGVLVDSEGPAAKVFAEVVRGLGLELTQREADEQFRGRSLDDCQKELERILGRSLGDEFLKTLNRRTYETFRSELRAIPGVLEAVERILAHGLMTCVASSGSHEKMQLTLSLTGLLPLFSGRLFSASEVPHGKPAPDLFEHAARALGVPQESCIVVEDSVVGARGARAAGMEVLGFVDEAHLTDDAGRRLAFSRQGIVTFGKMGDLPRLLGL